MHELGDFQRESLKLINSLIGLTASTFYLVGPQRSPAAIVQEGIAPATGRDYHTTFRRLDPLNPDRFVDSTATVISLDSLLSPRMLQHSVYYQDFMRPNGQRHVADMFLRHHGEIVAVISLLRGESLASFQDEELRLLRKLHPYLEYNLTSRYLSERLQRKNTFAARYGLTDREFDVLELLRAGYTNQHIADELVLGLATVKTHVRHILHKTGTASRSQLLARLLSA
ncbi:helix-turn-helix transcriptional regulator [Halomonas sp. KM-1]|uniref:helix-turn-helix transcriptional regulator n=1 Tax=Halomonas sp. KM-1 TaxID=590061 RepID=UPI00028862F0|nr:helix-turn-helix transcriptional regulator [Halomonas sp. KM-1]